MNHTAVLLTAPAFLSIRQTDRLLYVCSSTPSKASTFRTLACGALKHSQFN